MSRPLKYESVLRTRLEYEQRVALDRIAARRGVRLSDLVRSTLDLLVLCEAVDEGELAVDLKLTEAVQQEEAEWQTAQRAKLLAIANREIERRAVLKGKAATRT